jgi:rubrerythrin
MVEIDKKLSTIQQAIELEKFGYDFYSNMRLFVTDKEGHKLVSYLANLEIDHIKWLEDEYKKQFQRLDSIDEGAQDNISLEGKVELFLKDKNIDVFRNFEASEAIEFAIEVEKRSVEFYRKHMETTDDQDLKSLFNKLADYEKEHISILNETLKSLKSDNKWISALMHVHW